MGFDGLGGAHLAAVEQREEPVFVEDVGEAPMDKLTKRRASMSWRMTLACCAASTACPTASMTGALISRVTSSMAANAGEVLSNEA